MIDDDPIGPVGCLFGWSEAKGSLKQWLVALATIAALVIVIYALFSWLGL